MMKMDSARAAIIIQNLVEVVRTSERLVYDHEFAMLLEKKAGITEEELIQLDIYNEDMLRGEGENDYRIAK